MASENLTFFKGCNCRNPSIDGTSTRYCDGFRVESESASSRIILCLDSVVPLDHEIQVTTILQNHPLEGGGVEFSPVVELRVDNKRADIQDHELEPGQSLRNRVTLDTPDGKHKLTAAVIRGVRHNLTSSDHAAVSKNYKVSTTTTQDMQMEQMMLLMGAGAGGVLGGIALREILNI